MSRNLSTIWHKSIFDQCFRLLYRNCRLITLNLHGFGTLIFFLVTGFENMNNYAPNNMPSFRNFFLNIYARYISHISRFFSLSLFVFKSFSDGSKVHETFFSWPLHMHTKIHFVYSIHNNVLNLNPSVVCKLLIFNIFLGLEKDLLTDTDQKAPMKFFTSLWVIWIHVEIDLNISP